MPTTPDGIPMMSARQFSEIKNNPVQQLVNSELPVKATDHDPGYSVEENVFSKSRLDATLEEHKTNLRSR